MSNLKDLLKKGLQDMQTDQTQTEKDFDSFKTALDDIEVPIKSLVEGTSIKLTKFQLPINLFEKQRTLQMIQLNAPNNTIFSIFPNVGPEGTTSKINFILNIHSPRQQNFVQTQMFFNPASRMWSKSKNSILLGMENMTTSELTESIQKAIVYGFTGINP